MKEKGKNPKVNIRWRATICAWNPCFYPSWVCGPIKKLSLFEKMNFFSDNSGIHFYFTIGSLDWCRIIWLPLVQRADGLIQTESNVLHELLQNFIQNKPTASGLSRQVMPLRRSFGTPVCKFGNIEFWCWEFSKKKLTSLNFPPIGMEFDGGVRKEFLDVLRAAGKQWPPALHLFQNC